MSKSNENNMPSHSSDLSDNSSVWAPAPTLMYLIELDPSASTCMTSSSMPMQMLNVNQNNTHYLIPIQETDQLEILQYKQHKQNEDIIAQPSVSSKDERIETNTAIINGKLQSNLSEATDLDGIMVTNKTSNLYGSHLGNLKTTRSVDSFEQCQTTTERLSTVPSGEQPLSAIEVEKPAQKYVHIADSVPPPLALQSLPGALILQRGYVSPRKPLPPAVFGPVRGVVRDISREEARELVIKAAASSKPVFLVSKGDGFCHIDVSDLEKSNWFALLPLGTSRSANVWLEQRGESLFACSTRRLPARAPLRLGYAAPLAALMPAPPAHHRQEDQRVPWCDACGQKTQEADHKCPRVVRNGSKRRRRYRCKHCTRLFARLFTLRRHVSLYCKSKSTKTVSAARVSPVAAADAMLTAAGEDERVGSDESFHNYSGLDFPTPLFDPDRMPLDPDRMQFESDRMPLDPDRLPLDPAPTAQRDDSSLGLGDNASTPDMNYTPLDYSKKVAKPASTTKCPHCHLTISSNMKQRHKRQCASRGVSCACGAVCGDRERLARHVRAHHAPPSHDHKGDTESSGSSYKCDQCQNTFKRRGMLVNHSWRVHGRAARVPLARRQRHYPCVACPKLYRTAAKRDRHVRAHHPGAELARAQVIESGAVWCEPAACAACPRQYASRAKLLQHVRNAHPHLAPPSISKLPKSAQND